MPSQNGWTKYIVLPVGEWGKCPSDGDVLQFSFLPRVLRARACTRRDWVAEMAGRLVQPVDPAPPSA